VRMSPVVHDLSLEVFYSLKFIEIAEKYLLSGRIRCCKAPISIYFPCIHHIYETYNAVGDVVYYVF
jgi:hypothetical protein